MIRFVFLLSLLIFNVNTYAIETIVIERGYANLIPMAINKFDADNATNNVIAADIVAVISNDLKMSSIFRPISPVSFIEQRIGVQYRPFFTVWRQINANLLLNGEVTKLTSTSLKVSFILWDTILEKALISEVFEVPVHLWRRVAHKISDKIYEKITGDLGYFNTKVVYVAESGPYLKRVKKIALMDYDGANHKYLTNGKNLVLTPRFSPKADTILYLSYVKEKPHIYIYDLKTGKEHIVGNFRGMSFAPRFSPDGNKVLMSVAKNGMTHIFEFNLITKCASQLTNNIGINVSPSYSPDGNKIVFNSDRNGSRQLYIMNSDGSNVERISFGRGNYSTPSWSPKGDYIAFTKFTRSEGFTIGIMKSTINSDESSERIIASGYLVEGPCWAPNGRVIMFAKSWPAINKSSGKNRIYSIDVTGYNEREIITPQDASDPEWSKILN